MKKANRTFICQSCGEVYSRWAGKCESCGAWNTIQEETISLKTAIQPIHKVNYKKPISLSEISEKNHHRIPTGFDEFDLVLGGGIVSGSLILIGGEPGVGKSTLLLELCRRLSPKYKILYVSGEESYSQLSLRAKRMEVQSESILLSNETSMESIVEMIYYEKPDVVLVDSIQTITKSSLENQAGTVTQLRECTQGLLEIAKKTSTPIILVGHITKEGLIAGPKVLEHLVDTVLYFEGDKFQYYRLLRAVKNRFGTVGDVAIFEMNSIGLSEVKNKSDLFISKNLSDRTGSALSVVMEGSRSLVVEVQSLVSKTSYSQARRMAEGLDTRRLILMAAVLEKYCSIRLSEADIFANLAGGINVDDPGLDLALCAVILSSYVDRPIPASIALLGEVGLSGEVRLVSHIELKLKSVQSMGVKKIILPEYSDLKKQSNIICIQNIVELESVLFS